MNFGFSVEEAEAACKKFADNINITTAITAKDYGFTESGDFVVSIGPDPSQKFFTSPSWQYVSTGATYDEKVATPH